MELQFVSEFNKNDSAVKLINDEMLNDKDDYQDEIKKLNNILSETNIQIDDLNKDNELLQYELSKL